MKHTKLLFMAVAALFASSAMAETAYSYSLKNLTTAPDAQKEISAIGGTIYFGADAKNFETSGDNFPKSDVSLAYKMDGDYKKDGSSKKYVRFTLDKYLAVGDTLYFECFGTSTKANCGLSIYAKNEQNATAVATLSFKSKQTIETLNYVVKSGDVLEGTKTFTVFRNTTSTYFLSAVVAAAKNDATLKSITIDGEALADFAPATLIYNVELPFGTTTVPEVVGIANSSEAKVNVNPAASLPGTTTIVVTPKEGETKTYNINFTVAETVSTVATLDELKVNGNSVADFKSDVYAYTYEMPYGSEISAAKVTYTLTDEAASAVVTDIAAYGETATVVVTAQDGKTKLTYSVTINQVAAPKKLYEVVFSNGAKGAISTETADNYTVTVPYLSTEDVPTVVSDSVEGKGATATVSTDGKSIVLTGADGATETYAIQTVALTVPTSLGSDTVTFTGEETDYIFAPYGFGTYSKTGDKVDYKGWKFAKAVNEDSNRRISKGNTRIYMALPAAKEVALVSGTGAERPVKIYVNGKESNIDKTAKYGEAITIALDSTKVNFLAIESNQTSGDGGFIKIMITPAQSTAIDNAQSEVKAVKVLRNGQLLIQKGDKLYTAQGTVVE